MGGTGRVAETRSDRAAYRTSGRLSSLEAALEQGGGCGVTRWSVGRKRVCVRRANFLLLTRGGVGSPWSLLARLSAPSRSSRRLVGMLPVGGQKSRNNTKGSRRPTSFHSHLAAAGVRRASVGMAQGVYIAGQKRKKAMRPSGGKSKLPVRRTKSGITVRTRDSKKSIWR